MGKKGILILVFLTGFCAFSNQAVGQGIAGPGEEYYVTIGVFRPMHYAVAYTAKGNQMGFSTAYGINSKRQLYYVYVFSSSDRKKTWAFLNKLRIESEFKDAWVFTGHLGEETTANIKEEEKPVAEIHEEKKAVTDERVEEQKALPIEEGKAVEEKKTVRADSAALNKPAEKRVAKGKFFNFEFISKESGKPVRGEVHFLQSKNATQYQAFKANEIIDLPAPRNADGVYKVTTVAPGYKVVETLINYKDPLHASETVGPEGEVIVRIELEKAKRGDYIEFTNVAFYRNSVIFQPQSQVELDGLAELMRENPDYKVRIHGHCNGTTDRDIFTMGTSTKFFESDKGNKKMHATAMVLSELRAETAKQYLISQGISADRILTKGEGGKMMVYPLTSVYANYNDRVEVEVIRH